MGANTMINLIGGHPYQIAESGQVKPLSDEAADNLTAHGCEARYGWMPAQFRKRGPRKNISINAANALLRICNDRVDPEEYAAQGEITEKLKSKVDHYQSIAIAALRLDALGAITHTRPFAMDGNRTAKGVEATTSTGRIIAFYGSRREYVSPLSIDGIPCVHFDGVREAVIAATASMMDTVRGRWIGKIKIEEARLELRAV
jgi:hypothetical protein